MYNFLCRETFTDHGPIEFHLICIYSVYVFSRVLDVKITVAIAFCLFVGFYTAFFIFISNHGSVRRVVPNGGFYNTTTTAR